MRRKRIMQIAAAMSDGTKIDWERAESEATDSDERALIQEMKKLETLLDSNPNLPAEAAPRQKDEDRATPAVEEGQDAGGNVLRRWGHLEILEKIDSGAFGEVYRAWDPALQCEMALKLLRLDRLEDRAASRWYRDEILREGRLLARVRHPNVVTVYGTECHDNRIGLWMELISGHNLEQTLEEHGTLSAREAANLGLELCRALSAVHHAGLVHGDVKTRNVMRQEGGRLVLMDFGAGGEEKRRADSDRSDIVGTGTYMAPEVLRGEGATKQSDIYSLGVLLYHMVTKSYPIGPAPIQEMAELHENQRVKLLRDARPDLPNSFIGAIEKALAPNAQERFASAGEMEKALATVLTVSEERREAPEAERKKSWRRPLMLVAMVGAFALALFQWYEARERARARVFPAGSTAMAGVQGDVRSYRVDAKLFRVEEDGSSHPLLPGSSVQVGDGIYMEFEASTDMFVYVISEDEQGEAYLLFPLQGFETTNPLQALRRYSLPGRRGDEVFTWEVTSQSRQESLLFVASPERLNDFESEIAKLPPPNANGSSAYTELSKAAKRELRGIGGLKAKPRPKGPEGATSRLSHLAAKLNNEAESVRGVWARYVEFESHQP